MLTDGRTDGRTTDAGVTGILIAHLGAFGSGELKTKCSQKLSSKLDPSEKNFLDPQMVCCDVLIEEGKSKLTWTTGAILQ